MTDSLYNITQDNLQDSAGRLLGGDGSAVPGSTRAIGGESSPTPNNLPVNFLGKVAEPTRSPVGGVVVTATPVVALVPPGSPKDSPLCSIVTIPYALAERDYIVNFSKARQLIQPRHKYFNNKQAYISGVKQYKHNEEDEHCLLYLEVKGNTKYSTKNNPYNLYRNARAHGGRTVGQLRNFIENNNLVDVRMACPVFTAPEEMSKALAAKGDKGKDIFWRVFKRFQADDLPGILGVNGEMGSLNNLHVWASKTPHKPHFHIHQCLLNHAGYVEDIVDENGKCWGQDEGATRLEKWFGTGIPKEYHDIRWVKDEAAGKKVLKDNGIKKGPVPFSDQELQLIKQAWTKRLKDACKRNKIVCHYFDNPEALAEVYVDFVSWGDGTEGRVKFIHKINYQKRSWVEDFVEYSNANPDCDDPPEWLDGYENRSRPMGFWARLSAYGGVCEKRERPSPFTGEKMIFVCTSDIRTILNRSDGDLGAVDIIRGHAESAILSSDELAWLESASKANVGGMVTNEISATGVNEPHEILA